MCSFGKMVFWGWGREAQCACVIGDLEGIAMSASLEEILKLYLVGYVISVVLLCLFICVHCVLISFDMLLRSAW
uniref:Uncharacterized protein n=1 Tax=Rhizophora mucronata TaxID=61149 RepID=A0A2P2QHX0_RHIMU